MSAADTWDQGAADARTIHAYVKASAPHMPADQVEQMWAAMDRVAAALSKDEQVAARQELVDAQHRKDRALLVALIRHVGGRVTLSTDEVAFADPDAIITAKPTDLGDFVTVDVASWVKP